MRISRRRVLAIVRKELRTYQRNPAMVATMSVIPLVFLAQPLLAALTTATGATATLHHQLLYMLGIPALVPATLAAYSVVAERQQGTLEPILTTPIRRSELLLGKALAVLLPSLLIAYAVFALFLALVALFAHPGIAPALIRAPDVIAQVIFTPLIAGWSIWVAIAISTTATDIRVAQQLGALASLPTIAVAILIALNAIPATLALALVLAAVLVIANVFGWRLVSALFDRERLITSTR
jgi:ABC-type transport system involved in multi-copper enzyme maturation permease subunit